MDTGTSLPYAQVVGERCREKSVFGELDWPVKIGAQEVLLCHQEHRGLFTLCCALIGGGEVRTQPFPYLQFVWSFGGAGRGGGQIAYPGSLAIVLFWRHGALMKGIMKEERVWWG